MTFISKTPHADVVLIGGGIMSATLGAFLKQLEPDWTISLFERLDQPGLESSVRDVIRTPAGGFWMLTNGENPDFALVLRPSP